MGFLVLLIVLGAPVVEIWVMIEVGSEIGALPTIALILATAVLGTLLFRIQGLATLARVRADMDRGEMPVGELLSGLGLLVAGVLLLIPGFVTDIVGFLLFVPPIRRAAVAALLAWMLARGGTTQVWMSRGGGVPPGRGPGSGPGGGKTIDGDFTDVTDSRPSDGGPSGGSSSDGDHGDPRSIGRRDG